MAKKLFLFLFLVTVSITAQDKLLSVEDVVINSYFSLAPERIPQLKWLPGTDSYSWVKDNSLYRSSVDSEQEEVILTLEELNGEVTGAGLEKLSNFPYMSWKNNNVLLFNSNGSVLSYDVESKKLNVEFKFAENAENITYSPDQKYAAYTVENNLFVALGGEGKAQISDEKNKGIVFGQAAHRSEFGITGGIFWSPKSNYVAFYRMDETMVEDYPIVNVDSLPAKLENIKYPMAGRTSHQVTVGVYNVETGETAYLKTGQPKEQYLTNISWSPDESSIYVAHLNRDQNRMRLIKYDAQTGEQVSTLFEEQHEKYVEPEHALIFLPNDEEKFIWQSERDGWDHLYLYNTNGKMIRQITKGEWVVVETHGFDESGDYIYVETTKESPVQRHLYKAGIEEDELIKLTDKEGTHSLSLNSDGTYFIDNFTSLETPRQVSIVNGEGEILKTLLDAPNPLSEYKLGAQTVFSIKSQDGVDLYCSMITPPDFDETKKYPVIFYVYGGPHAQLVTNRFPYGRYDLWSHMMAEKGYIVFTLDNRGSANRGRDFEQATFRQLGTVEIQDQLEGISYLAGLGYADTSRVGVFGWSYGGFMTTSLMLRTDNKFKVGVGGGAVIDWKYYEIMYTERYMDDPQTNPEGYDEANLLNYVDNLDGKLLLVHGTSDPTVVWQHSLAFAKKAANLDKPLDYYPYIGHGHGVGGRDALHLYRKITNYFVDNL